MKTNYLKLVENYETLNASFTLFGEHLKMCMIVDTKCYTVFIPTVAVKSDKGNTYQTARRLARRFFKYCVIYLSAYATPNTVDYEQLRETNDCIYILM